MTERRFERFMEDCLEALERKNDALTERYGMGNYARWNHDGQLGLLSFSNPANEISLVAETTDIGSYSLETNTWLWAWANESLPDEERTKALKLKKLYDTTGMRIFEDAHFDCDQYLAWELAAASVEHLGSLGCYRGPADHLWVFWSIDRIRTS
jgi:hypothetical protein